MKNTNGMLRRDRAMRSQVPAGAKMSSKALIMKVKSYLVTARMTTNNRPEPVQFKGLTATSAELFKPAQFNLFLLFGRGRGLTGDGES